MFDELWKQIEALRTEYLNEVRDAERNAENANGSGDKRTLSEFSTKAEHKREAVGALSRAIKILEAELEPIEISAELDRDALQTLQRA